MITFTEGAEKALAELVHQLRPAWDRHGILAAIHAALRPGRDLQLVAHVAVDAACDPTARTPAVITTRDRTTVEVKPSVPPSPADRKPCTTCHQIHVPGQTVCHRTADPNLAATRAAEARQALAEAKSKAAVEADLYPSDDPLPPF